MTGIITDEVQDGGMKSRDSMNPARPNEITRADLREPSTLHSLATLLHGSGGPLSFDSIGRFSAHSLI